MVHVRNKGASNGPRVNRGVQRKMFDRYQIKNATTPLPHLLAAFGRIILYAVYLAYYVGFSSWTLERGGRCMQVVTKTGFTVCTRLTTARQAEQFAFIPLELLHAITSAIMAKFTAVTVCLVEEWDRGSC